MQEFDNIDTLAMQGEDWEVKRLRRVNGKAMLTFPKRWWEMAPEDIFSLPVELHFKDGRMYFSLDLNNRSKVEK